MAGLIQHQHGRVVDAPGDNVLAEFRSVVDAVQCAVEIQKKLKTINPDVALPNPGKSTSKTLQLRIFRRLGVIEDVTFGEVLDSPGKACSPVPKVPLQRFGKIPAALCGGIQARPPNTPARFL
jgi:hypothetical protein